MRMKRLQCETWLVLVTALRSTPALAAEKPRAEPPGVARVYEDALGRSMPDVAPQCPRGKSWVNHDWSDGEYDSKHVAISDEMTLALSLVDHLITQLPVDTTRVYVTGRSMGGFATWDAIARRLDFFAIFRVE